MFDEIEVHGDIVVANLLKIPWETVRVFTVTAGKNKVKRGNHKAGSNQLVVLIQGRAKFFIQNNGGPEKKIELSQPGQKIYLQENTFLTYTLETKNSAILVLSDRLYQERS